MNSLKQCLENIFKRYPEIGAVYLFGSRAEGHASVGSDIDLAIVPTRPGLRQRKLDLLEALTRAGMENVDLVIVDDSDTVLRYEAIRPNQLVYARPDFDHGSYYSRALREYFDFLPILEIQRKAYKKRLQHGQT